MTMDKRLRITSVILAVIGLIDSLYLAYVKLTNTNALCGPLGDCESVNSSRYAQIGGIPIAILGALTYLVLIAFLLMEVRGGIWSEYGRLAVFGISLFGVLYSVYLTYIEIAVLHAICPYCVVSAVILVLLLVIAVIRLLRTED